MADTPMDRRTITLHHTTRRTMTVQGVGIATLPPDIARFSVGISEEGWQVRQIQQSVARRTDAVLSALQSHGVVERDLQTTDYAISPEHDYREGRHVFRGYSVTTSLRVTVREIGQVGALLEAVTDAGATDIDRITFELDDPEQANRLARAEAVRNARAKAEELAAAVGATLGPVITVSDTTYAPDEPLPMMHTATRALSSAPPPIMAGEIDVAITLTITYALE